MKKERAGIVSSHFLLSPRKPQELIHILLTSLRPSLISSKCQAKTTEQHVAACHQRKHVVPNPIITMTFDALDSETKVLPLPTPVKKIVKCNQGIHLCELYSVLSSTVIKWNVPIEIRKSARYQ